MISANLLISLLFPLLVGAGSLFTWWPERRPGRWALLLGYGWLLGWLMVAAGLWVWGRVGLPFSLPGGMLLAAGFALVVAALGTRLRVVPPPPAPAERGGLAGGLLALLVGALILQRLYLLGAEAATLPLYPWDAWMNWAPKARVWFEQGRMVPFLPADEWLAATGPAYTMDAWHYPPFVPLVELWVALWAGEWRDSQVVLPWVTCLAALGLALLGQLRAFGVGLPLALVALYLLVSLPFVGVNVALAGYADLWLAALLGGSAMALLAWSEHADPRQGLLALGFALACMAVKLPGAAWSAVLLVTLAVARAGGGRLAALAALLVAGGLLVWGAGGFSVDFGTLGQLAVGPDGIALPGMAPVRFTPRPQWSPIELNTLHFGNWHLLWYPLPAVLAGALLLAGGARWARAGLLLLLLGGGALFAGYFLTDRAAWVADYTIVNRGLLHLVPAYLFLAALVWHRLTRPGDQLRPQGEWR